MLAASEHEKDLKKHTYQDIGKKELCVVCPFILENLYHLDIVCATCRYYYLHCIPDMAVRMLVKV